MEKYRVKSSFCVANQIVHIEVKKKNDVLPIRLPIQFAKNLDVGDRFDIFKSKKSGNHIAYRFNNQLLFVRPILSEFDADALFQDTAGFHDFSADKFFLTYRVLTAMRSKGLKPTLSMPKNIFRLHEQYQR